MNRELLKKYLNNNCSEKEFGEFENWLNTEALKSEGKILGFSDWETFEPGSGTNKHPKYAALLDKIHHKINLKNQTAKKTRVVPFSKAAKWLNRAAAILFIPLLGSVMYLLTVNNFQFDRQAELVVDSLEIIAPIGSRTVVQLSDGTEVNLNYGSRIKYPRVFVGDTREIRLEGEGYFDVAHNPDKPFVVKTAKLDVKALGTEFNVQAYRDDVNVATTLVEGKVVIEEIVSGEKNRILGTMVPGQHVDYNVKSGLVSSTKGNIDKYVAWKDGKLVFDNEPISGVVEHLSRMFNVDFDVDENVKHLTYTVTFVNDPLFLILDLMTQTTPVKYTVSQRKKLPDGTFTKLKIKIEER